MIKNLKITEFGDFQTPRILADQVARLVFQNIGYIKSIVEPTCGLGNFIRASVNANGTLESAYGWEINPNYVRSAKSLESNNGEVRIRIEQKDFFSVDWSLLPEDLMNDVLFIGNPPWVTNSELGRIGSSNLPQKTNFQRHKGLEAITGKGNFDISEWMLIKISEYISNKKAALSFLVKTSVAGKIFFHISRNRLCVKNINIYTMPFP